VESLDPARDARNLAPDPAKENPVHAPVPSLEVADFTAEKMSILLLKCLQENAEDTQRRDMVVKSLGNIPRNQEKGVVAKECTLAKAESVVVRRSPERVRKSVVKAASTKPMTKRRNWPARRRDVPESQSLVKDRK
jgi:hypothetical protein